MRPARALAWVLICGVLSIAGPLFGAGSSRAASPPSGYAEVERLMSTDQNARAEAARRLIAKRDRALVPGIVDALFFTAKAQRAEALSVLRALTGLDAGERYLDWVDTLTGEADVQAIAGYAEWKAGLFARIDRCFGDLLRGVPSRLRLELVVFGGVRCEGIPALDHPPHGAAAQGDWLSDDERVFGAAVGSEQRAYPVSVLSWHEMVNDELGGEPITLSYCTLCGSAILFSGIVGDRRLTFGTSGLLYRSNKLMLDRSTRTLWHNLNGEAVLGPLAATPARLSALPLTATTWGEWRRRHPATTVLLPDRALERSLGYDYRPGAAERHRAGVRFPTGAASARLPENEEIYGLRIGDAVKAYVVSALLAERVVNDRLAAAPVVLTADAAAAAIRAYRRGEHLFRPAAGGDQLLDESDRPWQIEELALVGPAGERFDRLPGTLAFWRGWFGFFPQTEVYSGASLTPAVDHDKPAQSTAPPPRTGEP